MPAPTSKVLKEYFEGFLSFRYHVDEQRTFAKSERKKRERIEKTTEVMKHLEYDDDLSILLEVHIVLRTTDQYSSPRDRSSAKLS